VVNLRLGVLQVIAFAQGRDNRHYALRFHGSQLTELTTIVTWCMGVKRESIMTQA
jgi:hypothetical protein